MINRIMKGKYEQPYSDCSEITFHFQIIVQVAKKDLRPTIPTGCPELFSQLLQSIWNKDVAQRQSTYEIWEKIKEIEKEYNAKKREWDALVK